MIQLHARPRSAHDRVSSPFRACEPRSCRDREGEDAGRHPLFILCSQCRSRPATSPHRALAAARCTTSVFTASTPPHTVSRRARRSLRVGRQQWRTPLCRGRRNGERDTALPGDRLATFTTSFGATDASRYEIVAPGTPRTRPGLRNRRDARASSNHRRSHAQTALQGARSVRSELEYFSDCVLNDRDPEHRPPKDWLTCRSSKRFANRSRRAGRCACAFERMRRHAVTIRL